MYKIATKRFGNDAAAGLATAFAVFSGATSFALAGETTTPDKEQEAALPTVTVTVPLNKALEVNAGAFGAKDTMEIPIAIQTYDAKTISDSTARTAMDVLTLDPSVAAASYGSNFDNFRLRGFAVDQYNTFRRDGLSLVPYHDVALENIERIDVLKGPSGFLYGFNSPGGSVNYIVKRPTKDPLLNMVIRGSSLLGRYAAIDTGSSALDGKFGYRINAAYEKNGNFDHARDMERKFIAVATDIRLSDTALLQLNTDWYSKTTVADPLLRADQSGRANPLDPSSYVLPPRIDRRKLLTGSWFRYKAESYNVDGKLEIKLGNNWVSVTQANYSHLKRDEAYTDLFSISPDGNIGFSDLFARRGDAFASQSFQTYLSGKFMTGGLFHELFVGASRRELKNNRPFSDYIDSGTVSISDISVGNILNPVQPGRWDFGPRQATEVNSTIKESAVYASDLISLNDHFQVLMGGRYLRYRAKDLAVGSPSQQKNMFVPAGALIYRPIDNLMLYTSYAQGLEGGEFAPYSAANANQPTNVIESKQFELGAKTDIGRFMNAGAALFEIRRDASYLNSSNYFVSDGQYRHRGVELTAHVLPAKGLTFNGNVAYMLTKLEDVADLATLGKRTEGVPKWKWSLGARYAIPGFPGFTLDGTVSYVGSRPIDAQNSGFIPGYTLFDAGVTYESKVGSTPVIYRLYGKNLANKYYYASAFYQGGLEVGRGREVFLSAEMRF